MMISAAGSGSPVVGREVELALLGGFLDEGDGALVLTGSPGIGKTTVWEAGLAAAAERSMRVISARAAPVERELSYVGLADLLEEVTSGELAGLPGPQRLALEVALLRAEPHSVPAGPRAVAAGLVGVLRGLATRAPLLVAVDDVQWLDGSSAQALAFAARRLQGDRVRFLLSRRDDETSMLERAFAPEEIVRLELGGLSLGAVRNLLARDRRPALPRNALRRVYDASGGNPLAARELARLLAERGGLAAGEELPVSERVEELVGARVASLPLRVRRLVLAAALSPGLRRGELERFDGSWLEAVDAGVLVVDRERVRVAHPLFAAVARAQAGSGERREMHRQLAAVVTNEELSARHLALATEREDAALAARLTAAAERAAARGAAGDAAELAEHALRLTPPDDANRTERLFTLAERLEILGEHARGIELVKAELRALPGGEARVRAHLSLVALEFQLLHVDKSEAQIQQALAESEADPGLHALATARWSCFLAVGRVQRIPEAERCALEVLPAAGREGPALEREVLFALALTRKLRGQPIDDVCERFAQASSAASSLQRGVERIAADRLGTRGQIREARAAFRRLLALADDRGEGWSSTWLLHQLCELELRAGEWETAATLLAENDEIGSPLDPRGFARCRAMLAVGRGDLEEAVQLADETIAVCAAGGLTWNLLEALRARGLVALLARDAERAAESLGAVWEHTEREGVTEPAEFPVAHDLVEALVELDRLDEAAAVAARLHSLATAQAHPWGLASAARCGALLALAATREVAALDRLTEAADSYETLGLRFDHARTLFAAGRWARRLRKWGAARDLLERAAAAFDAIGSPGWSNAARGELSHLGGRRRTADGGLTAAERRVAALAAEGLSNKEIAATLVVSVATVETQLKRARAKLGVRSRSQLAGRL